MAAQSPSIDLRSTPGQTTNDGIDIATITRECISKLQQCLNAAELNKDEWGQNRLAELRFWSAGIGALAQQRASLDARLVNAGELHVRLIILQLLRLMSSYLDQCLESANTSTMTSALKSDEETDAEADSDGESVSSIDLVMQDIDGVLEQLADLAVAIRRSGTRSRLARADRSFDARTYSDLHQQLALLIYVQQPKNLERLRERFHQAGTTKAQQSTTIDLHLDPVQKRLIDNNLRRRHRFIYAQNRALKLAQESNITTVKNEPSESRDRSIVASKTKSQTSEAQKMTTPEPSATRPLVRRDTPIAPTVSSASGIATRIVDNIPRRLEAPGRAQTVISTTASKIVYPRPPKVAGGSLSFLCPACCLPQPVEIASQPHKWRNHIAQDLAPYTCILEACPKAEVTYVTRDAWAQHMDDDHKGLPVWECILCDLPKRFFESEDFLTHLSADHPDSVKNEDSFAKACLSHAPATIDSCPLCTWMDDQEGIVDPAALRDHIAEHVHSFSLRSLPAPPDSDPNEVPISTERLEDVQLWLRITNSMHHFHDISEERKARIVTDLSDSEDETRGLDADLSLYTRAASADAQQDRIRWSSSDLVQDFMTLTQLHSTKSTPHVNDIQQSVLVRFENESEESAAASMSSRSLLSTSSSAASALTKASVSSLTDSFDSYGTTDLDELGLKARFEEYLTNDLYHEALRRRHPGTNEWIFGHASYQSWKKTPSFTFCLSGQRGSGKTILCASIIEDVQRSTSVLTPCPLIAYHFLDRNIGPRPVLDVLVRSIIWQFASTSTNGSRALRAAYRDETNLEHSLDLQFHLDLLDKILDAEPEAFIMIDAIEALLPGPTRHWLDTLEQRHKDKLHILVTMDSNELVTQTLALHAARYSLHIDELAEADVHIYLRDSVAEINAADVVKRQIERGLISRSTTFLHAHFLLECVSSYGVVQVLHILKQEGLRTIQETLDVIITEESSRKAGKTFFHMLQWAFTALHRLTLPELSAALTIRSDASEEVASYLPIKTQEFLEKISRGFVVLCGPSTSIIKPYICLRHRAIAEFLSRYSRSFSKSNAYGRVAADCFNYLLNFCEHQANNMYDHAFPLAQYAANYWHVHLKKYYEVESSFAAELRFGDLDFHRLFNDDQSNLWQWVRLSNIEKISGPTDFPGWQLRREELAPNLYYATHTQLVGVIEMLILQGAAADINTEGGLYGYPLHVATKCDNEEVIALLLDNGADIDIVARYYGAALHTAVRFASTKALRLLLDRGANVNATSLAGLSALVTAVDTDHESTIEMMDLLLSAGAAVDLVSAGSCSALWHAISLRREPKAELLIRAGADINLANNDGISPLHLAASMGYEAMVKKLCADPRILCNVRNQNGETPLFYAVVYNGRAGTVQALVDAGVDVDLADEKNQTPLSWAAEHGLTSVLQVLIAAGAELEIRDTLGETALAKAVVSLQRTDVAAMLLRAGANPHARNQHGESILRIAARYVDMSLLKILLEAIHDLGLVDGVEDEETPVLHVAARVSDTRLVQRWLGLGIDVNLVDSSGTTALIIAAGVGAARVVRLLLDAHADVQAKDKLGQTALIRAASAGHTEVVRLLLDAGTDVEAMGVGDATALTLAAGRGHIEVVRLLLDAGANTESRDDDNQTVLIRAARLGHSDVVPLLLDAGADLEAKDGGRRTALMVATSRSHVEAVRILCEAGADTRVRDKDGLTPLLVAAWDGSLDIARLLVDAGANLEARTDRSQTALIFAVSQGHADIVGLLLNAGADVQVRDENGQTALMQAASKGHTDLARLLLDAHVDVQTKDKRGQTALLHAVHQNKTDIARLLVEAGADVEAKDEQGQSALAYAVWYDDTQLIHLLVHAGAHVEATSEVGQKALIAAVGDGNTELVRLLLDAGADVETMGQKGQTALMIAVKKMDTDTKLARLLLDTGADVEAQDEEGRSALIWAASSGNWSATQLLLESGADVDAHDNHWTTAIIAAVDNPGAVSIDSIQLTVEKLIAAGADVNALGRNETTALLGAARYDFFQVARTLVEAGASMGHRGGPFDKTAIELAQYYRSLKTMVVLVAAGCLLNQEIVDDPECLPEAAGEGAQVAVLRLLQNGADPNAADSSNRRPLHRAIASDQKQESILNVVDTLLSNGAWVDSIDRTSSTPLLLAVTYGQTEIVKKLLAYGADPERQAGPTQITPLEQAIANGDMTIRNIIEAASSDQSMPLRTITEDTDTEANAIEMGGIVTDSDEDDDESLSSTHSPSFLILPQPEPVSRWRTIFGSVIPDERTYNPQQYYRPRPDDPTLSHAEKRTLETFSESLWEETEVTATSIRDVVYDQLAPSRSTGKRTARMEFDIQKYLADLSEESFSFASHKNVRITAGEIRMRYLPQPEAYLRSAISVDPVWMAQLDKLFAETARGPRDRLYLISAIYSAKDLEVTWTSTNRQRGAKNYASNAAAIYHEIESRFGPELIVDHDRSDQSTIVARYAQEVVFAQAFHELHVIFEKAPRRPALERVLRRRGVKQPRIRGARVGRPVRIGGINAYA